MDSIKQAGFWIIIGHVLISTLHGIAHFSIPVGLNTLQWLYVMVIITALPFVALWQLERNTRQGMFLLAFSMAGAFLFGLYNHFIGISPDHVAHIPNDPAAILFQVTAVLLGISEAMGVGIGFWGWMKAHEQLRTL